jgi:hypothetical protein
MNEYNQAKAWAEKDDSESKINGVLKIMSRNYNFYNNISV